MDELFELRLVRNPALACEALTQAVVGFEDVRGKLTGPSLPGILLVLPMALHGCAPSSLAKRQRPGALFKTVAEDPDVRVGVQTRLTEMAGLSFEALNVGFAARVLAYDSELQTVVAGGKLARKGRTAGRSADVVTVLSAAKRMGQALAESSLEHVCGALGVVF
jgi:hypothetical protein